MSKWDRSEQQFHRDLVTAFCHPAYREMRTIDALAEIRRNRGEYV